MVTTRRIEHSRARREKRSRLARVVLVVAVLSLTYALARIQILHSEEYALEATTNRLRALPVPAPRGTIYDRHGAVVAENVVGYQVQLMPAPEDSLRAQVERLQPVLDLDSADIEQVFRRWRQQRHLPLTVVSDASETAVARLEEYRHEFPAVLLNEYPKRRYSAGASVSNVVGYVAEISQAELEMERYAGYRQGRWIGKTGLEQQYEEHLGGEPGVRYLEIDAGGRIKSWLPEELGVPAIPGRDLHLHLDLDLQRYVAELFQDAEEFFGRPVRGGFAAIEPQTGGVLALYSHPTYDPNLFVGGIDTETFSRLREDPAVPLLDRASGSRQAPGSTFKLPHAAMALRLGVVDPEEFMPIACTGGMSYQGRYAQCWSVHGRMSLIPAIKNSCNVYFYQLGIRIGLRQFLETGTRLGFGGKTGLDLPTEQASIFPRDIDWMESWAGYRPNENEVMSLSIGQGAVTQTPLKNAHLYVPLARADAKAHETRLAKTAEEPPIALDYGLNREQLEVLRQGMRRVTGPGGTAYLTRLRGWDFMGKTGTAQKNNEPDHGWFTAIGGPMDGPPEIVASILIENGLHGSDVSGWVGNAVNFYLSRKHDRPFVRYPTARERNRMGLPTDWSWLGAPVTDPDNLDAAPDAGLEEVD